MHKTTVVKGSGKRGVRGRERGREGGPARLTHSRSSSSVGLKAADSEAAPGPTRDVALWSDLQQDEAPAKGNTTSWS